MECIACDQLNNLYLSPYPINERDLKRAKRIGSERAEERKGE
jgi:hypothetical protein